MENFFVSLFSIDGKLSSKRFFGGLLIITAIAGTIIGVVNDSMSTVVESLIKTDLYTGAALLGINMVESVSSTLVSTVKRPSTVVKPIEDDTEE